MSELTRDIVCDETETCPTLGCEDCIFERMNKKLIAEQERVRKLREALDEAKGYIEEGHVIRSIDETLKEVEGV